MNPQGMASAVSGPINAPVRQLDVPAALESLSRQVAELENIWGNLDNRLTCVSHNSPPSTHADKQSPVEGACEVSQFIRSNVHRLHMLKMRMEEVFENLEI